MSRLNSVVLFGSQHVYPDSDWSAAVGGGPQRGAPAVVPAVPDLHRQAGLLPLHLLHAHRLSEGQSLLDKLSHLPKITVMICINTVLVP